MTIQLKGNVLIIDDNAALTDVVAYALNGRQYQATVCFNVEDALDNFEKMKYDLVIIDIFMTGMGGIEGIQRIRKHVPHAPIIAISGGFADMPAERALRAAIQMGADGVLPKPFDIHVLTDMVEQFLKKTDAVG